MVLKIYLKYGNWLRLNDYLIRLVGNLLKTQKGKFKDSFEFVIYFLFIKSYSTFKAINLLCGKGYGFDSAMLTRSLLENLVDMLYISKDQKERSGKFLYWEAIEKKTWMDVIENNSEWMAVPSIKKAVLDNKTKIINDYNQMKIFFPDERKGWSQKTITNRIKESRSTLLPLYNRLCCFTHPSTSTVGDYIKDFSGQKIFPYICPNEEFLYEIFPTSHDLFYEVLEKFNEVFKLKQENKLKQIKKKREVIWNKYKKQNEEITKI